MTIILALANQEYVIQLSDRRLSSNGKLVDDDSNKAICLVTDDSRTLVGFSGLAECGSFKTRRWILDTLNKSKSHAIYDVFDEFKVNATEYFNSNRLMRSIPREDKRLSIMFTGYVGPMLIGNCIITNYQDLNSGIDSPKCLDEFQSYPLISEEDSIDTCTFIHRIGAWRAMTDIDEKTLRSMLIEKKPRIGVMNKAISLIRQMSDRRESGGTIGKQINSACLEKGSLVPICGYHTTEPTSHTNLPDMINLTTSAPTLMISDLKLELSDPPSSLKEVRKKAPCPCGSGKRFKRCHGKRG